MITLFQWTYKDGQQGQGAVIPVDDPNIVELVFTESLALRKERGLRMNEYLKEHEEAAAGVLPPNLRIFRAERCMLRTWPNFPPSIHEVYMGTNMIRNLPDLSHLQNLIVIELPDNSLEKIEHPLPPTLARLNLHQNALREWNLDNIPITLMNLDITMNSIKKVSDTLRNLRNVADAGNPYRMPTRRSNVEPIERIAPNPLIQNVIIDPTRFNRYINRVQPAQVQAPLHHEGRRNVYENGQNVHDSGLQDSTRKAITKIMGEYPDIIFQEDWLLQLDEACMKTESFFRSCMSFLSGANLKSQTAQILKTFTVNEYVMHGVEFTKFAERVWVKIRESPPDKKPGLLQRLKEEVNDGKNYCQNGMIVRLVNLFVGFDEAIEMRATPRETLQARISATLIRLRREYELGAEVELPFEANLKAFKQTLEDMKEVEIPEEHWQIWLEPFWGELQDTLRTEAQKAGVEKMRNASLEEFLQKNYNLEALPWMSEGIYRDWIGDEGKLQVDLQNMIERRAEADESFKSGNSNLNCEGTGFSGVTTE